MLYGLSILILMSTLVQLCLSLLQCEPIDKLWNPNLQGSCSRLKLASDWSYFQGAVSVLADTALALWPITIVWNLQTTLGNKLMICSLMGVGVVPAITVILRMTMLPYLTPGGDLTYDFYHFMLWSTLELWLVIILGSLPPLRPLFIRVLYDVVTQPIEDGKWCKWAESQCAPAGQRKKSMDVSSGFAEAS
ncbi:Hypothetical protein D9617_52g060470 [Elsinoe fawcettii]|nr:Hypothetical protein D9617_52g060470 [Elsinoe fawcettii]